MLRDRRQDRAGREVYEAQWPEDHNAFRISFDSPTRPPDKDGRESFTLLWWQDGRRRAQCFFAHSLQHIENMKRGGRRYDHV